MMSRSIRPVSVEISAQVRRETTADLILVRSPFEVLGELNVERFANDHIQHRIAEKLHSLVALESMNWRWKRG